MKKKEFNRMFGYVDQAPRCYLCSQYQSHTQDANGRPQFFCVLPQHSGPVKVKPNGICNFYQPGPYAKNKDTIQ